ncbi:hypothetical protein LshimejAT787_0403930 [Lyophyllum shimeji]|uniref:Uncharacterized protein n=1 Tax=Lyophyllum shimeji TaxID=47721 RepID=A0A9P3PJG9_LYOSH|nr:hypothetical protein LshimejAT787_0403930 [Lyophyllum shimeji]
MENSQDDQDTQAIDGLPETLEKIFQKVEEESERRVQEELASESVEANGNAAPAPNQAKKRRRGSISVTRFGELAAEYPKGSPGPSTPTLSTVASRTAFYQAQAEHGSTESFASGASEHLNDEGAHVEDNHVTQIHQIAGRQSISKTVGKMLSRRLSRARSANIHVGEGNVIIGVAVEEATVESAEDAEANRVVVHAPRALRNQPSRLTMAGSSPARNSWVAKAKGFTQKFRRKSKIIDPASPL